jgi:iron complex outermembrane receptor protein
MTRKRNNLMAAMAAILPLGLGLHGQGTASSDEPVFELEAFEVTSFEGSLVAAAEAKRLSPVIIEAVVAEDLGKLPDVSIAETLARLPGLTTQRINSRAQGIVIRGLTGDFSTALLNGRQQVSTGAGRSVEFDQYPSELLNGVVVYKTTTPSLVGQGLAGTVDMQTVRPLEVGVQRVGVNAFYEWSELGQLNPDVDDTGMRYSLNYIDQFNDGTLGIAFGYAHTDQPGQGEQWNAWGYPTVGDLPGEPYVLGGAKPFVRSSNLERDSYMGVIEYQPSKSFSATIDLFYSDFAETQVLRGIELPLFWSGAVLDRDTAVVENGLVTQGTFTNFYGVMRNDIVWRDAEVFNAGLNLEFGDGSGWVGELDISTSRIDRKDNVLETYSGFASNQEGTPDTITYSLAGGTGAKFDTLLDYSDANAITLAGPQGWGGDVVPGGQVGFFKGPEAHDQLDQVMASMRRDLNGVITKIEAGINFTKRGKDESEAGPDGKEGFFLALADGSTRAPLPPVIGNTSLSFIGIPAQVSYDPVAAFNSGIYSLIPNDNPASVSENWDVTERVMTGYVEAQFETKMGDIPVTGTFGTQVIRTNQESNGLAANGSTISEVSDEHSYTDFVPSFNASFQLSDLRFVRLSLARQIARQPMREMRAGSTYSFNEALAASTDVQNSPWGGYGGNVALEPWRSNSIDISFENYFAEGKGYVAIVGYMKDLKSYTYTENALFDFTGYPTGSSLTPAIYEGYRSTPQNGDGGEIKGLELSVQVPGSLFTDALEGFGMLFSIAEVDSSIKPDPGNPSQPIPGLSDRVINSTVYYEKAGFSARVSARYRSDYRGDIATFGPRGANFRNLQAETVWDAQVSYAFDGGPLDGVTVILQGYNLTDEPLFATQGDQDSRLVQDYQRYGAQYSVGVSYKF